MTLWWHISLSYCSNQQFLVRLTLEENNKPMHDDDLLTGHFDPPPIRMEQVGQTEIFNIEWKEIKVGTSSIV